MRDENIEQPTSAEALTEQQRSPNGLDDPRADGEARTDSSPNAARWVPLAYDLEQNSDSGSEYRGEVF